MKTGEVDYLSKSNTDCLKGILACGVLIHHLYQYSGLFHTGYLKYLGTILQSLGFTCTAMFFFLSGYGLMYSYKIHPTYINQFPRKKILPFYCIIVFYVVVYSLFWVILGKNIQFSHLLKSLSFGGTVIKNGWYLQIQLLFYLLFYFVFLLCKNRHNLAIMSVMLLAFVLAGFCVKSFPLDYERSFAFLFGMIWASYREQIEKVLFRREWLATQIVLLCAFGVLYFIACYSDVAWVEVFFRMLSYFPFITFVLLLVRKIKIVNKRTEFLGKISLELYVLQGIPIAFFRSNVCYIKNVYAYLLACAGCTFLLALLFHPVSQKIYKAFRK